MNEHSRRKFCYGRVARLRNLVRKKFFCEVLELCCFECFQNPSILSVRGVTVLELCCFECFQNMILSQSDNLRVLELCCFECFQNIDHSVSLILLVLELCCFECFQNVEALCFTRSLFQSCVILSADLINYDKRQLQSYVVLNK